MNTRLNKLVNRVKHSRDKNFRDHLYIFLICCGISLFIWFLIKMSDDYVSEISIPLKYNSLPADKLLTKADNEVSIRLHATGGDLFSAKFLSGRQTLDVNLGQVDLKKNRYFDNYYILSSQLRSQLLLRFDFAYTGFSISPDTLFLEFEEIITRSIPVIPDLEIRCKPQYQLYDSLQLIPSAIMVSGPTSIIDTLSSIATVRRSLHDLEKNTELEIPLALPYNDSKVRYSETEVKAIISVEAFTESSLELAVNGLSDDSGITIQTFPESIQLTYQVAIKDYQLVKPEMFTLSVTYDPEKDRGKNFLKVRIEQKPDFVRVSRIYPDKVEFIIRK